ncbi:inducible T-cell costimulator [Orycteropus afer afer]|uniref:Inducible T-cell costimulator n=1 Tax=Orycteropus afer afer TaxID=1230840 RepID=A0A8B6ZEU0_ORYAF|nr:inducible T-cell costimulator [Orycteropus afer afer]
MTGFRLYRIDEKKKGKVNDSAKPELFTFHNGGVRILCKHPETIQQFKMQLLKGRQILCELTKTKESGNRVSTIKNTEFCHSQLSNNSVSFFLHNLDTSHASYYFCQLMIFDPPPYHVETYGEYLHVYESQFCCQLKLWLPVICAAFVVLCILGCAFISWLTKKKYQSTVHEPNSEYMSMAAVNTAKIPGLREDTGSNTNYPFMEKQFIAPGCAVTPLNYEVWIIAEWITLEPETSVVAGERNWKLERRESVCWD